jgi:hypothetical protein
LVRSVRPPELLNRLVRAPREFDRDVDSASSIPRVLARVQRYPRARGVAYDRHELRAAHEELFLFEVHAVDFAVAGDGPGGGAAARGPRLAAELERQLAAVFASVSVTVVALALLLRRAHDPAASSGHLRDRVFPAQRVDELVEEVRREIEPRRAFEERVASGDALGVFSERRRRGRGRKQIPGMRLRRRRRRRHHSVREHLGPRRRHHHSVRQHSAVLRY